MRAVAVEVTGWGCEKHREAAAGAVPAPLWIGGRLCQFGRARGAPRGWPRRRARSSRASRTRRRPARRARTAPRPAGTQARR
jgi:hypothetical protein